MNKANGGNGIPVELFQILKDNALKVLHTFRPRNQVPAPPTARACAGRPRAGVCVEGRPQLTMRWRDTALQPRWKYRSASHPPTGGLELGALLVTRKFYSKCVREVFGEVRVEEACAV